MTRLATVLLVLSLACTVHAQHRGCAGIVAGLSTMPDEPPAVHGAPYTTIGRRAAIEALSASDPDRARQLFELAASHRALGRLGDEVERRTRPARRFVHRSTPPDPTAFSLAAPGRGWYEPDWAGNGSRHLTGDAPR